MREFKKVGLSALAGMSVSVAVANSQPNVVFIVADDLGYADAGFTMEYAMSLRTSDYLDQPWDSTPLAEVHTPNIDRLAQQGVVFTSGYVNGNVCSPTRAGFMLGRYQQRVGVYGAGQGGSGFALYEDTDYSQSGTNYARINPMFPEFLRQSTVAESNYVCGAFGKWHLGIDEIYQSSLNGTDGLPNKQDMAYTAISANFEEPDEPAPIDGAAAGTYDPTWIGGSPWHCLNRGFDKCFYFMGRGGHDYWDPNGVYDSYDPAHPQRRTTGLDPRYNPGYSGADDDNEEPRDSWDTIASAYEIHAERVPTNYLTPRITQAACDFIGQHATNAQPFFCYVPYNAAHSPLHVPYHFDPVTGHLDRLGTDTRRYNVLDGSGNPVSNITDAVVADWYNPKTPDPNWFPDPLYLYEKYKDHPAAFRYFSGGTGQAAVKADDDIRKRCITLAMVRWMDKGIGEIMQRLRDPDGDGDESDSVYDNTIILFISDNGGAAGMNAANAPLAGSKSTNYEGGLRSPFVFSWPQLLKAQNGTQVNDLGETVANQQLIHAPVMAFDFLPTILDINGLDPLSPDALLNSETQEFYDYTPDGKSMMPLIRGEVSKTHDYLFWCDDDAPVYDGAVRRDQWKLRQFDDGSLALYDLDNDIAEQTDVSAEHPEILRELRQAYFSFMNSAAESIRWSTPNQYLFTTLSSPPAASGTAATEEFEYAEGTTIASGSNGGHNWSGSWQKTSTTDNGQIIAGSLLFNDPAGNYVDGNAGNYYAAYRKQIEINRAFSSSAVAGPVWFCCLVENMEYLATPVEDATHYDQQRWEFHPNNIANTYLRVGDGDSEYSRFVANGTSADLDVPVDLDTGTYLVVMRMETDVSGNNDSVKVWILPEGTAITGYSEAALGTPNLDKNDADLWSGGLTSMGFAGDAYQNQIWAAARLDSVRVSYAGSTDAERIESLFSPTGGEAPPVNVDDAVTVQSNGFKGGDPVTFTVEYDELAGWLSDDASSGVVFEKATSLVSNDWTVISPASTTMLDWWNEEKSYVSTFELVGETNGFIRIRQE